MKPTIDSVAIAKLAGVSRSTVSKVINNYASISALTKERIWKVIREKGYTPNMSARILAGKKTETLGFFLFGRESFASDALVNLMIATVIESAAHAGFHILTYIVSDSSKSESKAMVKEVFQQGRIDAGIVLGAVDRDVLVEELVAEGYVLGVFDLSPEFHNQPNLILANLDDEVTASRAVEHLYAKGHRSIGVINGDHNRNAGTAKARGFQNMIGHLGMECRSEWVLETDFSEKDSFDTVKGMLRRLKGDLPSCFVAVNDAVAFGAIRAFEASGLSVPQDVSIVGIDDHPFSPYVNPPLTTFSYDFHEVFQDLIARVVGFLVGKQTEIPRVRSFPATLRERGSCRDLQLAT